MPKHFVRIAGLKEGEHRQEFKIKDKFFEAYEQSEVKKGNFMIRTLLTLKGLDRKLSISIEGKITNLLCDYCAENLDWGVETTLNFVIKESQQETESTDEIIYVLVNQHQLNINQLIFEMINLTIPSKISHPLDENGNRKCKKEMLELIDKYAASEKEKTDPRWGELNKLRKTIKTK